MPRHPPQAAALLSPPPPAIPIGVLSPLCKRAQQGPALSAATPPAPGTCPSLSQACCAFSLTPPCLTASEEGLSLLIMESFRPLHTPQSDPTPAGSLQPVPPRPQHTSSRLCPWSPLLVSICFQPVQHSCSLIFKRTWHPPFKASAPGSCRINALL